MVWAAHAAAKAGLVRLVRVPSIIILILNVTTLPGHRNAVTVTAIITGTVPARHEHRDPPGPVGRPPFPSHDTLPQPASTQLHLLPTRALYCLGW